MLKYHHNDLKQMIDVMAAVEADLKAGRYRSALRRRDVLIEGLGQVKTYLKGEFTVRQDQTANLPTDIQKEILGTCRSPSPPRLGRTQPAVLRAVDVRSRRNGDSGKAHGHDHDKPGSDRKEVTYPSRDRQGSSGENPRHVVGGAPLFIGPAQARRCSERS